MKKALGLRYLSSAKIRSHYPKVFEIIVEPEP